MANRFNELLPGLAYNPESFKDMAYAPMLMRQRHDKLLDAQDKMMQDLFNTKVIDDPRAQEYFNNKKAELTGQIEGLTQKINSIGAGSNDLMNEFRNMKRGYEKELSLSGGIGMAADLNNQVKQRQSEYDKVGLAQKWTPTQIQDNYQREYQKYLANNDFSQLGQDTFIPSEFKPTLAPEKIDALDSSLRVHDALGYIGENIGWDKVTSRVDENGLLVYDTDAGTRASKENVYQLDRAFDYFNKTIMDPNSPEMISERYARRLAADDTSQDGQIRKEWLEKIRAGLDLQTIKDKTTVDKSKEEVVFPPGGGSGSSKIKSDEDTALVSTPTGQDVTTVDFSQIGNKLAAYEAKEAAGTMTQQDIYDKKKLMQLSHRVTEMTDPSLHPEIIKKINQNIANEGEVSYFNRDKKILTLDDIKEERAKYQKYAPLFAKMTSGLKMTQQDTQDMQKIRAALNLDRYTLEDLHNMHRHVRELDALENKVIKNNIEESDLAYSKLYTFGTGESAAKIQAVLEKNSTYYGANLATLLKNSGGKFTIDEEEFDSNVNQEDYEEKLVDLSNALQGDAKIRLTNIKDSGSTGISQFEFMYQEPGTDGRKGRINVDYDNKSTDTSVLDDLLNTIKLNVDSKSRAVIQSIIDNKKTAAISLDKTRGGYSDKQSETLVKTSRMYSSAFPDGSDYRKKDYMGLPGRKYSMVLTSDGYHELYMGADKKELNYLTTGQWLDREFASYQSLPGKKVSGDIVNNPKDKSEKDLFVRTMFDLANFSEYDSDNKGVVKIGVNQKQTQDLRRDFITKINNNEDNLDQQYVEALNYYNQIRKLKIAFMNKKQILASDTSTANYNYRIRKSDKQESGE